MGRRGQFTPSSGLREDVGRKIFSSGMAGTISDNINALLSQGEQLRHSRTGNVRMEEDADVYEDLYIF